MRNSPKQAVKSRNRPLKSVQNLLSILTPPFPSLGAKEEYMVLEPDLRPPNKPPARPGMELRPECPIYEVSIYMYHSQPKELWFLHDYVMYS